ncbi:DMT family transporter [Acanthopleuribacter pedis]|uniref:DMT family transporter n=1 Tax=Acanthopleuribacter pedis TaxID=442870 RepID=A0A8J7QD45_9BACT|nr:DMT family transporter [Acanthopleuribacter pedis]MBO1317390.1 DMT family transporter [Acanthopleuribacter pedis]
MIHIIMYAKNRAGTAPLFLLFTTGALLGANFPLGKVAATHGFSPLAWAWVVSMGAVLFLGLTRLASGRPTRLRRDHVRFVVVSGVLSFVLPNLLLFSVIPHIGAGFSGLMFALSPVFTTVLSVAVGWERISKLGLVAVALGLIGAALVSWFRASDLHGPSPGWLAAALAIPVILAVGNVYRSWDWPAGAEPDQLALWSQILAAVLFTTLLLADGQTQNTVLFAAHPVPVLMQAAAAGLMFPLLFRLQQVGGPILLSQIGYVAAGVGLVLATVVLGERYPAPIWIGAALLAFGLALTTLERTKLPVRLRKAVWHKTASIRCLS